MFSASWSWRCLFSLRPHRSVTPMSKNSCLFSSVLAEAHTPVVAKMRHFASLAITSLQINFGVTHAGDSTAHTHTYTCLYTNYTHQYTCTHTPTNAHVHIYAYIRIHTRIDVYTHTIVPPVHPHKCIYFMPCPHLCTCAYVYTLVCAVRCLLVCGISNLFCFHHKTIT